MRGSGRPLAVAWAASVATESFGFFQVWVFTSTWILAGYRRDGFDDLAEPFERSAVLADYLGSRFVEKYSIVKRTEQARYNDIVSPLDYQWYLRNV